MILEAGEEGWRGSLLEELKASIKALDPSFDLSLLKLIPLGPHLGALRCGHLQVEGIRRLLSERDNIRVLGVSGTLKGARRKFLDRVPARGRIRER